MKLQMIRGVVLPARLRQRLTGIVSIALLVLGGSTGSLYACDIGCNPDSSGGGSPGDGDGCPHCCDGPGDPIDPDSGN